MDNNTYYNKPILFCIFNRIDCTRKSFECIRRVKPKKLYITCDGPRESVENEDIKVKEVIEYVENHIDWECEVYKNYSNINLGSRERISTAISWALINEEDIVIMEDDIVPSDDFYVFCERMLDLYKKDEKVMMVSGMNIIKGYKSQKSHFFSCFPMSWGWATWRTAWSKYDDDMIDWPKIKRSGVLKYIAPWPSRLLILWNYRYAYNHEMKAWDFVWHYTMSKCHGLGVVPKENLVANCGFNSELATNTKGKCKYDFGYGKISFPLEKDEDISRNEIYDKLFIKMEFNRRKALRILFKKTILYIPRKNLRILK